MKGKVKSIVILMVFILCGSVWAIDDPVAYWPFDEGKGDTAYDSAGDNDGTLQGDPQWVAGKVGDFALDFDGDDDYGEIADDDSLDFGTGNFTVLLWLKSNGVLPSTASYRLLYKSEGSVDFETGWSFYVHGTASPGKYGRAQLNDGTNYIKDSPTGGASFVDGYWHHFAGVVDRTEGTITIYNDTNEQTGTIDISSVTGSVSNSGSLTIGRYPIADIQHFNGIIDDVRIYDRALSAEEVKELYFIGRLSELVEIEIVGPDEVAENWQAQYQAIAHFEDESTLDVTDVVDWSVEPNDIAAIDSNGLLETGSINRIEEIVTVMAEYTADEDIWAGAKDVTIFAVCPLGTALDFDGEDDYVEIPDDDTLDITGHLTVSAWVNIGEFPTLPGDGCIVGKYDGEIRTECSYRLKLETDGRIAFGVSDDGGGFASGGEAFSSVLTADTWYHVAGVYIPSTSVKVYVNGVEDGDDTTSITSSIWSGSAPLGIGADGMGNDVSNALIDDVRIYDRALSAEEIRANMHTRLSGYEPGLVAYWDFDEGQGQVAYDMSSNGNDGTLGSTAGEDDNDPNWIDEIAPVGRCSPYEFAIRSISGALEIKLDVLELLEGAMEKEAGGIEAMEIMQDSREYEDLSKQDVQKARIEAKQAVQREVVGKDNVEKSIDKLQESLNLLGNDVEP